MHLLISHINGIVIKLPEPMPSPQHIQAMTGPAPAGLFYVLLSTTTLLFYLTLLNSFHCKTLIINNLTKLNINSWLNPKTELLNKRTYVSSLRQKIAKSLNNIRSQITYANMKHCPLYHYQIVRYSHVCPTFCPLLAGGKLIAINFADDFQKKEQNER